jgi:hypothetical protein
MTNDTESKPYTCSCGKPTDKITSGAPECWDCWNWRKMDGPAARHWVVAATIAISNVDYWDTTEFMPKKVGLSEEEFLTFVKVARKIRDESKRMLIEHGAGEDWIQERIQKTYDSF